MSSNESVKVFFSVLNLIKRETGGEILTEDVTITQHNSGGSETHEREVVFRGDGSALAWIDVTWYPNGYALKRHEKIIAQIEYKKRNGQVLWNNYSFIGFKLPVYESDGVIEPCLLDPVANTRVPGNLSLLIHATIHHFIHLIGILENINSWNHSVVEKWTKSFIKKS